MKKSYLLILCITLMLLLITAVSATNSSNYTNTNDNTNINTYTQQNTQDNINTDNDNHKEIKTTNNIPKKESNNNNIYIDSSSNNTSEDGSIDKPYKTLNQTIIDNNKNNTNINVHKGTYYLNTIIINKNITINGDNSVFIANSSKNIFNITKNNQLTLINITLKNYSSYTSAAIQNDGSLIIKNSTFENNRGLNGTSRGGSIYTTGTLTVLNSTFSNNYASWGASIYTNQGNTTIINSQFSKDSTQNVGGTLYNIRGNLNVISSNFTESSATSGGAIYNAFGNLNVNNSIFFKNSAASFYGGAIYSTGIARVNNSKFQYNNATYMGGAITNTNNFTAINSSFESNFAGESGGVIENIAWTRTENGNLTLINCNFTENSAVINGGVIVNLNTTPVEGNYGTITSRNCIYQSNSAGAKGGAICSDQYINLEYNVFTDNEAENGKTIYANETVIKTIENNWWGSNNPTWKKIGVTPKTWIVMNFTNTTPLVEKLDTKLLVTLNTLNNGEKINSSIPVRKVIYLADTSRFETNFQSIEGNVTNVCTPEYENISVRIDDEKLTLKPLKANITYNFTNENQTLQVNVNLPKNINGKISLKINGKTILNKIKLNNGTVTLNYSIPSEWANQNYTLNIVINTKNGEKLHKNITIIIPKRNVDIKITINNKTTIKKGDTIQIVADITCGGKIVKTGRVAFKINGKTIQTNVRVINGKAIINYTIPQSFSPKNYTINVVYSGDKNKNGLRTSTNMTIDKQSVHISPNSTMYLMSESGIDITISVLDTHNNYVTKGKICYKINGKTIKTNITLIDGVFSFDYITPKLNDGKSLNQTLTIKMGENNKYYGMEINIPLIIQ